MVEARPFFRRVDETTFEATVSARGPWDPLFLHGGPPSALLCGFSTTRFRRLARPSFD